MNLNETEKRMKGSKLMERSRTDPNEVEKWMKRSKLMEGSRMNPNETEEWMKGSKLMKEMKEWNQMKPKDEGKWRRKKKRV